MGELPPAEATPTSLERSGWSPGAPPGRAALALLSFSFFLATFVAGYSALTMVDFEHLEVPGYQPALHDGLARYLFDPWQRWDGQWFLRIAQSGYYRSDGSAAFLPGYPWIVRTLSPLFSGDHLVSACLVSWVCFAAAVVLLERLLRVDHDAEHSTTTLVLLVTFPTAMFFHAAYSESLFLLLTVIALGAARRGAHAVSGLAALGATLTRWTGFGLIPALLVEAWHRAATRDRGGPVGLRELCSRDGLRHLPRMGVGALVFALLPALALPIVMSVLRRAIGEPWGFSRAQRLWERRLAPPWTGLVDGARVLLPGRPPYLEPLPGGFPRLEHYLGGFLEAHAYNLIAALAGLALSFVALRRVRPSYAVWALAGVVLPLMTPSRLQPLQSMPRFLVVLFPLFLALAHVLRGRPLLTTCTIAAFAALQGYFIGRFVLWYWVA